jgi:uncharacterized protein YuzE
MTKNRISGEIVASQTARLPSSEKEYGYITVQTPENDHVKLKVDMGTNYETIERGERVVVEYDQLGGTDILAAKKIVRE